ncbi:LysR family transcriptional regulator [Burkholderia sp. SIMBA_062]|uniref:LysR family transcriptional regulator n=1 Tax=Burkholderia sp. SIMBA_062 TaxID=3085803 RepID=UPI00397D9118
MKSDLCNETRIEPNHFVYFASIVRHKSFTDAAKETGASKSTLSRVVSMLEECAGTALLERTTRCVTVTEAGYELFQRCLEMYLAYLAGREAIASIRERSK